MLNFVEWQKERRAKFSKELFITSFLMEFDCDRSRGRSETLYRKLFPGAFANKSTIVIRTLAKWNSCGSKPAALLFRENTCRYNVHKGITHCYYHMALARNISKWTGCRAQIFGLCSMLVVTETDFRIGNIRII